MKTKKKTPKSKNTPKRRSAKPGGRTVKSRIAGSPTPPAVSADAEKTFQVNEPPGSVRSDSGRHVETEGPL